MRARRVSRHESVLHFSKYFFTALWWRGASVRRHALWPATAAYCRAADGALCPGDSPGAPGNSTTGAQSSGLRAAPGGSASRFEPVEWQRFLAPGERRIGAAAIDAAAVPACHRHRQMTGRSRAETPMDRTARTPCQAWPSVPKRPLVSARCLDSEPQSARSAAASVGSLPLLSSRCRSAGAPASSPLCAKPFERFRQFRGVSLQKRRRRSALPRRRPRNEPGFPQPTSRRSASRTRPPRPCRAAHRPLPTKTHRRAPRRSGGCVRSPLPVSSPRQRVISSCCFNSATVATRLAAMSSARIALRSARHSLGKPQRRGQKRRRRQAARRACAMDAVAGARTSRRARPAATRPRPGRRSRTASATSPDRRSASQPARRPRRAGTPASTQIDQRRKCGEDRRQPEPVQAWRRTGEEHAADQRHQTCEEKARDGPRRPHVQKEADCETTRKPPQGWANRQRHFIQLTLLHSRLVGLSQRHRCGGFGSARAHD